MRDAGGKRGEPPRLRTPHPADATGATGTGNEGAGAQRAPAARTTHTDALTGLSNRAWPLRSGDERGAHRAPPEGPKPPCPHAGQQPAAGQGAGSGPARLRVRDARRTATGRAAKCHPAQRGPHGSLSRELTTAAQRAAGDSERPPCRAGRTERGGAGGRIASCALLTASESVSDGGCGMIPFPTPSKRL